MPDKPRRCPGWCASGHEYTDMHQSRALFLPFGRFGARATAWQAPGHRKYVGIGSVDVTSPRNAADLARLLEDLADATPEQHRELAGQVRAAAVITFGAEVMEGFR